MALTIYLVGAGLTKALECTRRVPMMMDFVPVLTEYVDNDIVLNTLVTMELGQVYENPCNDCLAAARRIARNVPGSAKLQREQFAKLVASRQLESIEVLFERVESTSSLNIYGSGLANYFRYAINQVFSAIRWDLRLDLVTRLLGKQFQHEPGRRHVLVSFNYDLALDRAVEIASAGLWQPADGYGFEFPFYTQGNPTSSSPSDSVAAFPCSDLPKGSPNIQILKPHGSLNWLRPRETVRRLTSQNAPASMVVALDNHNQLCYWPAANTFNYISRPGELPEDFEPFIVPPSLSKLGIMQQIQSLESDAIAKADQVFVVGYSLPRTDQDQRSLISAAVESRKETIQELTIVNKNASAEYLDDVGSLFRPEKVRIYNDGFADFIAQL